MYCRKCGTKLPDDSKYCKQCGAQIEVNENSPETTVSKSSSDHSALSGQIRPTVAREFNMPEHFEEESSAELSKSTSRFSQNHSMVSKHPDVLVSNETSYYLRCFLAFEKAGGTMRPTWNWLAFLFGPIWYLAKGLWAKALMLLLVSVITAGKVVPLVALYSGLAGSFDYYLARLRGTQVWVGPRVMQDSQTVIEQLEATLRDRNAEATPFGFWDLAASLFVGSFALILLAIVSGGIAEWVQNSYFVNNLP